MHSDGVCPYVFDVTSQDYLHKGNGGTAPWSGIVEVFVKEWWSFGEDDYLYRWSSVYKRGVKQGSVYVQKGFKELSSWVYVRCSIRFYKDFISEKADYGFRAIFAELG